MDFRYILGTIAFTVYGQLIMKWQISKVGAFPNDWPGRGAFVLRILLNPWVLSGLVAAFLAMLCWMAALSKMPLSSAYPFTSLGFVLVLVFGAVAFREAITLPKLLGVALIMAGIAVGSRG